ncbi:MAG: ROK family protein [Bacilli bacterium]|nr:ROK family protein [Bacilli bacterium]
MKKKVWLGIDIGGTSIKFGYVDEEGKLEGRGVVPVKEYDPQELTMARLMTEVVASLAKHRNQYEVEAIGLGVPGAINFETGTCDYSNNLHWDHCPVTEMVEKVTGIPAYVDNDANAALLGEVVYGGGKGYHSAILLTLGTGVGGGVYLDDRIFRGNEGKGAELGHMVICEGGKSCTCGRRGCLEVYGSATGLRRLAYEAMERHPKSIMWQKAKTYEEVDGPLPFWAAGLDDEAGKETIQEYVEHLGNGILNFINIFRPEVIILAGGVTKSGDALLKPLDAFLAKNGYGYGGNRCPKVEIKISKLTNDAGIYGAAGLAKLSHKK